MLPRMTRLAFLALLVTACGGSSSNDVNYRTESNNGQCVVSTGRSAGDACEAPEDCGMGCCACSGSSKHYSASACVDKKCAVLADACALSKASSACD